MVYAKPKASDPALAKPILHLLNGTYVNKRGAERMWNVSGGCPMLRKQGADKVVTTKRGAQKKVPRFRKNGALSAHTIKTLASGAACHVAGVVQREAEELRNDVEPESSRYPIMPSVSQSAARMLDQAVIAFSQHVFAGAMRLKSARAPVPTKVTFRCAKASLDASLFQLSGATSLLPPASSVRPLPKTITKSKKSKEAAAKAAA